MHTPYQRATPEAFSPHTLGIGAFRRDAQPYAKPQRYVKKALRLDVCPGVITP
jgi:hypothetical protein